VCSTGLAREAASEPSRDAKRGAGDRERNDVGARTGGPFVLGQSSHHTRVMTVLNNIQSEDEEPARRGHTVSVQAGVRGSASALVVNTDPDRVEGAGDDGSFEAIPSSTNWLGHMYAGAESERCPRSPAQLDPNVP